MTTQPCTDRTDNSPRKTMLWGLSARLLVLTILFVLLAEILIFVPSIARFRRDWLQDKANQAYLIALAARTAPDGMLVPEIETEVLVRLQALALKVELPATSHIPALTMEMRLSPPTPETAADYDLYQNRIIPMIVDALAVLTHFENRPIQLMAMPTGSNAMVTLVLHEQPLAIAARAYAIRILELSLVISIIAGTLVFLSLNRMLVRPIRHITSSMIAFRTNPEADLHLEHPGHDRDEIGRAAQELAYMQQSLRDALHQKTRLAMLGTALTKINHDLRNILSSAALLSERLASSQDLDVQKIAPRLEASITRAVTLCEDTLAYARDGRIPIRPEPCDLIELMRDVGTELQDDFRDQGDISWVINGPSSLYLQIDPEQCRRVIRNLGQNALQAGAQTIIVTIDAERQQVMISDNGPGLAPRAREFLFVPFAGSTRIGGTGLGLALARDIMRAHGGDLQLLQSDATGTVFRLLFS